MVKENIKRNYKKVKVVYNSNGYESKTNIKKCLIKDSTLADVSTFLKKDFYNFPKMIVENCELKSKKKFLNQEGSYLLVDKKIIDSDMNELDALTKSLEMTVIDQCNPQDKSTLRGLMQRVINPEKVEKMLAKKVKKLTSKGISKKIPF